MKPVQLVVLLGLMLAACSGHPPRQHVPAHVCSAGAQSETCRQWIAALPAAVDARWHMLGRVAIVSGAHSGNARIEWQQQDAQHYQVLLSAPLTRQSWQLSVAGGEAVILGLPQGPRRGADAAELLREATGWDIPVLALRYWLRGYPAPDMAVSQYRFAADGRLLGLVQNGWHIEFTPGAQWPARISASQGQNRVRLVVDDWSEMQ
ncbi:MAG: lipoprotein insertase outer membrane protein LolB [Pseudomonadota bacterium]|nr:lipoprotein insertase outer membrane protein LolB [Pseudomonadota bacterium]